MVYSQYELYIWEGVTEIFSIKLCSNVWGDFSSKGELENSPHLRIRKINLYFCYVELGTNLNKFEQVLLCYIRMKDKYETSMNDTVLV